MIELGKSSLIIGLICGVTSLSFYGLNIKQQRNWFTYARISYALMTIAILLSAAALMILLLKHQFQVQYVYENSSRDLPLFYLISAFWAGQEGSFLLWTLLSAGVGIPLIFMTQIYDNEDKVLFNYLLIEVVLILITIKSSPFKTFSQTPLDGAGLNDLLQNLWMVIHPPLIFLGYALYGTLYALAIAALWKGQYEEWIRPALPWTLMAWLALGIGIMLGGVWSYKTLGWGGYWAWDPVENASLIPWLTGTALFHGMILQLQRRRMQRTNFLLAIISFLLILYGTFLTRSGILANFSVHSFTNLEFDSIVLGLIAFFLLYGGYFYSSHSRQIPISKSSIAILSKEFSVIIVIGLLIISSSFVFMGTSSPILTGLLGKASNVTADFYNTTHIPIGILLAVFIGICPLVNWQRTTKKQLLLQLLVPLLLALVITALAIKAGSKNPVALLFIFASCFAIFSNAVLMLKSRLRKRVPWSSSLSHMGFGFLVIGIIVSSLFDDSKTVNLAENHPVEIHNYRFTFKGVHVLPDGRNQMVIELQQKKSISVATPTMYYSKRNEGVMAEPYVYRTLLEDIYISPLEYRPGIPRGVYRLIKGTPEQIGNYVFTFMRFRFPPVSSPMHGMMIEAEIQVVKTGAQKSAPHVIRPRFVAMSLPTEQKPVTLQNGEISLRILQVNADPPGSIVVSIEGIADEAVRQNVPAQLLVEISRKPLINFLWLGMVCIVVGGLIAVRRRIGELK